MAVVSVPRPLRDRLGDAAADSLVDMLRHFEDDQEQRRAIQKEHLLEVLDERFLRHLAETEERLHDEISTLRAEVGTLRTDLGNQIADVRKELNTQTRWILAVMVGATVLIPGHAAGDGGTVSVAPRGARLFRNGRNQALRIPRDLEFAADEVILHREDDRLVVEPVKRKRTLAEILPQLEPIAEEFPEIPDPPPMDTTATYAPNWSGSVARSATMTF